MPDLWQLIVTNCSGKYAGNVAYTEAIHGDIVSVTYGQVLKKVERLSASILNILEAQRTNGGHHSFSVLLPNCTSHVDLFFAAAATRAKIVCLNHRLMTEELQLLFERGHSPLLFASEDFAQFLSEVSWASAKVRVIAWVHDIPDDFNEPLVESLSMLSLYETNESFQAPPVQEDTWLQGFFTSGSTGAPKSVSHTHKNVYHHTLSTMQALGINENEGDCWGHFGPLFHCGTPAFIWISAMVGARQVFHENQFQFIEVANMMQDDQVTMVKLMPTILKYLLSAEKTRSMKFHKLKWVLTGGMKPTLDVIEKTNEAFGCQFIQGYGMTEATVHCAFKNESLEPEEDGMTVLPGLDLRILNESDGEVPSGTVGEICIRGPTVFAGYDNAPDMNLEAFTKDGYFRSGDLGYKNKQKQLYISGRSKDMIIVGGENVFAMEVEQVITRLPGIFRCAVFGGPDEALGEVVHCAVMLAEDGVLHPLHDDEVEERIHRKCAESLAAFKVPVAVHIWRHESFPMTGSGKMLKHEIRAKSLETGQAHTKTHKHFATKEAAVVGAVASVLGRAITQEDFHTPFMDLHMASMEFTRVINLLGGMLRGGELSPTLLFENDTLDELIKHILEREDLVLVAHSDEIVENKSLEEVANIDSLPVNRWSQLSPLCLVLQLVLLLVRPIVLMIPVMFAAWAGWIWYANHFWCKDCYWTLIFVPFLWPLSIIVLMIVVVILKWLLIGCCTPSHIPLWSPRYHLWLCMYNLFQSIDPFLAMFRGTPILNFFYNRCGAHITYSTELHTSNLTDPDLIRIHGDCVIDRACNIQPSLITAKKNGYVILAKIRINKECFVGYGVTIEPHVTLERGSYVRPLRCVSVANSMTASDAWTKRVQLAPWLSAIRAIFLFYLAGLMVGVSVAVGAIIMYYIPSQGSHIIPLMLPAVLTEGATGVPIPARTAEDTELDFVWWTTLPLVVFLLIPHTYFLCVVLAKHLIVGYAHSGQEKRSRTWKSWLYVVLIDCPLFRIATQYTVMSHVTKWQFRLLGCKIGDRAYFCAPFIRDPELVEIGNNVIVAGNVALLTSTLDHALCNPIILKNESIVANTVVLQTGCEVREASIIGDGVCVPANKVITENMVAVRDNSDAMPYIMMKRSSVFQPPQVTLWTYVGFQVLLVWMQLLMTVGAHIPGYLLAGLIVSKSQLILPQATGSWPFMPLVLLTVMTSKILLIPILKWAIACRFHTREIHLFGLRYVVWIAFEAVLFDADHLFLQTLCGTTFLSAWYWLMGAHISRNVCLMGSSVGCEYDLKHLAKGVVLNHASLLFSHSVERGTLIFRHTHLESASELGVNCVAEAGARLMKEGQLLSGQVAHAAAEKVNETGKPTFHRTHSETFKPSAGLGEVSSSLQRGYHEIRNQRAFARTMDIARDFSKNATESQAASRMMSDKVTGPASKSGRLLEKCMNLDDFERVAREVMESGGFGYYLGGATDEWTLKENRVAFEKYRIIPRVMLNVSAVNMRCTFFGINLRFPVMIAPSAMHGQAHSDAEKATARAAVRAGSAFTLSSLGTMSMEDVAGAVPTDTDGMPKGLIFQLYVFKRRDITEAIVRKAERLGYKALCLTVDAPVTGRRERDLRSGFAVSDGMGQLPNIQMLGDVVNQQLVEFEAQKDLTLDWSIITWLKTICNLPIIAKGILHPLDAPCAIDVGAAAIVVSNHGGRQLDSTPATIDVLPAIAEEVAGEIPIFLDGGIRRGTDVFKALGLGASAVMLARPAVFALAVGGEHGVSRMLRMLHDELECTFRLAGCTKLQEVPSRIISSNPALKETRI